MSEGRSERMDEDRNEHRISEGRRGVKKEEGGEGRMDGGLKTEVG